MQTFIFLFFLPYLALGHWRCQDGSKANCDQACTDESSPEIPAAEIPTTVIPSTEFDGPVEAEKYEETQNIKHFFLIVIIAFRFRILNPCSVSASQTFDKSLCSCADGSAPTSVKIKAVCSDNSKPDCSGSCPDGSDPTKLPRFLLM